MIKSSINNIRAVGNAVLVTDLERGWKKTGALIAAYDIDKYQNATGKKVPRWCRVVSIGDRSKVKCCLKEGDWILVECNRWTPRFELDDGSWMNNVEETSILLVSDEEPKDMYSLENAPYA